MVKVRVTSGRAPRQGPGSSRVRFSLLRKSNSSDKKHADRLFPPEKDRDTSLDKKRGRAPATLGNYSSRLNVGRREPRTSRRFAPGLGKNAARDGGATKNRLRECVACKQRSWTWCKAGLLRLKSGKLWVRFPRGQCGPVAQWIERLMFPGRTFPSSSFAGIKNGGPTSWKKRCR